MPKLTQEEVETGMATLSGWHRDGDAIRKPCKFANFTQAMEFVNRVAHAAEAADHHPDIDIRYNEVILTLSTHSEGGLTQKDFDLAQEIDHMVS